MYEDIKIGNVYKSRRWGDFQVVERVHGKGTVVRFLNTGNLENTNAKEIRDGKVCDRKALIEQSFKVGNFHPTNHWGDVEIMEVVTQQNLTVKFVSTGNIKTGIRGTELRLGKCKDTAAHKAGTPMQNFVSPQRVAAMMHPGETYESNFWGLCKVIEYKSSTEVLIKFLDSGNTMVASRDNLLKGLVKDSELARHHSSVRDDLLEKERAAQRAEANLEREIAKANKEEILKLAASDTKKRMQSRMSWYKIVRDFKCHFGSSGELLSGREVVDRNGYSYTVIDKESFGGNAWRVAYTKSGNVYVASEENVKSGNVYDKFSEECAKAEKLRIKLVNAAKYESDRPRRIAMASAYQKNNVERTRVRNRNRRALRMNAPGKHTLDEVLHLLESQDNKCACCGIELTESTRELDHKMPLIRGGYNSIENLQWLCQFCNSSKNASHPDDWAVYSSSDDFKQRRAARLSTSAEDSTQILLSTSCFAE